MLRLADVYGVPNPFHVDIPLHIDIPSPHIDVGHVDLHTDISARCMSTLRSHRTSTFRRRKFGKIDTRRFHLDKALMRRNLRLRHVHHSQIVQALKNGCNVRPFSLMRK